MEENTKKNNPLEQPKENGGIIKKRLPFLWELLKIIVVAVIIVVPIRYFIFQPFIVRGESMVPNLQSGDYLIVDELSYRIGDPQRGDIVVLKYPLDITQKFIKRVIGLPGETVQVKNGKIHILKDGKSLVLDEKKYLPLLESTDGDVTIVLEKDMYFVLGDNRQFSYDSRRWGVLPEKDIIGRALFRVFPLMTISYISAPSY